MLNMHVHYFRFIPTVYIHTFDYGLLSVLCAHFSYCGSILFKFSVKENKCTSTVVILGKMQTELEIVNSRFPKLTMCLLDIQGSQENY